jgi:hypothetical protein
MRALRSVVGDASLRPAVETAYGVYLYPALFLQKYVDLGTNVYDREWDLLVVLDACRVDALRQVAPEFDFLGEVGALWSVGSTSKEWYANTFQGPHPAVGDTALVSGNPWPADLFERDTDWSYWTMTANSVWHGNGVLDRALRRRLPGRDDFAAYVTVSEDRGGDCGTVAVPELVTDAAVHTGRRSDAPRTVVHYMQPHAPYLQELDGNRLPEMHRYPFDALRDGDATRDEVWAAYLDNLRLVLEWVGVLLDNVDAERVAITADHGELFGEWGLRTHIAACPHPALRRVPWALTTAEDTGDREPEPPSETVDVDTEQRLADLGYL